MTSFRLGCYLVALGAATALYAGRLDVLPPLAVGILLGLLHGGNREDL